MTDGPLKTLRAHGLTAKRSFGQCFLADRGIAARIAELATDPPGGTVLEIGAGLGALTEPLLARAAQVTAIERDRDLVPLLRAQLSADHLTIVEADAARAPWSLDGPRPHVVCGNLPYQITGRLIERTVGVATSIDRAVFMVQAEVADRLVAESGGKQYGVLTVFTQAAFVIERALRVPAGAFAPRPKVDSAVVTLTPRAEPIAETEKFREVVKSAFVQRRKRLGNAWRKLADKAQLEAAATAAGIDLDARAETLSVADFAAMARALK